MRFWAACEESRRRRRRRETEDLKSRNLKFEIMPKQTTARSAEISRKTRETQVKISLNLDGSGKSSAETGVGFLNHMLDLLARHSLIDLTVNAEGDLEVDSHHTVEDVGIVFGQAWKKPWATNAASTATAGPTFPWTNRSLRSPSISPAAPPSFTM